ncbi:acyltransferase family protein [Thalassotalea nanhaiensis]|uniref:Acyltransferase family protein n=1 Tax=Thalassotalea nanhaiensis TaxID=3065648 RepID=A0ABY9TJ70_9GAMM|nr:acyltransferase family protein [Colwelliaceae bacterium SQ345]
MNNTLSIYFDFIRFVAALMVVHSHILTSGLIPLDLSIFEYGREAVIIFFVLSGYVISYTTKIKNTNLKDYFVARASRIYSVALPVILLAFIFGFFGAYFVPEAFSDFYQINKPQIYIPFHLLFLGEVASFYEKPFLITPYWSLSYEVWYYVIFAIGFFCQGWKKIVLLVLLFLFLGFRLTLLFPIWYSGVLLYKLNQHLKLKRSLAWFLFILSLSLFVFFKSSGAIESLRHYTVSHWPDSLGALASADRVLSDYIFCLLICINFASVNGINFNLSSKIKGLIRGLSSYTFTLYLSHMLIIEMYIRLTKHSFTTSWAPLIFTLVSIAIFTFLLG